MVNFKYKNLSNFDARFGDGIWIDKNELEINTKLIS